MFNLFKKKKEEPEYDITNLSIHDLKEGFIFDYDMKSWMVKEVYEYDWGGNNFSREYKVDSGDEVAFLEVSDDGGLEIGLSKPLKLRKIEEDVFEHITEKEKAPRKIHVAGELFHLEEDSAGYYRNLSQKDRGWEEMITYEYYNEEETHYVSLTQWDDSTLEASIGKVLEPYQISNIIPAQS